MRMRRRGWLGTLLAVLLAGPLHGSELPAPPAGHILDEAGLFTREPERLEALSERLVALSAEHGLPVHVVLYGGLLDGRSDRRARRLHNHWIGADRDGLVVVWDGDTGELGFGLPHATFYQEAAAPGRRTRLPDQQVRPILEAVRSAAEGDGDKRAAVERLVEVLAARLEAMLAAPQGERGAPLGAVVLATVVLGGVLALLGTWGGRLVRRETVEPRPRCRFPDVLVGARLGAPHGGGLVAVVDYRRDEPEDVE